MRYTSIWDGVGNTPMVELKSYARAHRLRARLFAKLEYFNPTGSVKDRAALSMTEDAERRGTFTEIAEATSGNLGISLAALGAERGYRVFITMPETMSEERKKLLRAYGAEVILTAGEEGMAGAMKRAEELARKRGAVLLRQFENPANPAAHFRGTGPEIRRETAGMVAAFVAGIGSGGTITGVGRYLKRMAPTVKIIGVEPASSPVLGGGRAGAHGIAGIGAGFVPAVLDRDILDEVIAVTDEEAVLSAREMGREGLLAGISSGAALAAAEKVALREEFSGKTVVVLFPDGGGRYLSTPLFSP